MSNSIPPPNSRTHTLERYRSEALNLLESIPFSVFLCGPSLTSETPAAKLRKHVLDVLKSAHYDVFLGEDDGLEDTRLQLGMNAQDNELEFISRHCNAVIIVAESPGSFCELGLFSWHFTHKAGRISKAGNKYFAVLVDQQHRGTRSYVNEGPLKAIGAFGKVHHSDFSGFDLAPLLEQLKEWRAAFLVDRRGRKRP